MRRYRGIRFTIAMVLAVALSAQAPYAWAEEAAGSSSGEVSDASVQQYEETSNSSEAESNPKEAESSPEEAERNSQETESNLEESSSKLVDQGMTVAEEYVVEDDTAVLGLCQVSFPSELPFVIDPFEIAGRGSVYSEPVEITNNGDEAVTVVVEQLSATAASGDASILTHPVERSRFSSKKEIQISMFCSNGDTVILGDGTEHKLEIPLQAKQSVSLYVKGSVTIPEETSWVDGDIRLTMHFNMIES